MTATTLDRSEHSRAAGIIRALGAAMTGPVVALGVPVVLWRTVGWPLPRTLPTVDQIKLAIELRDFSDRLLIGTLAMIVWIAWAMTVISAAVHLLGRARHITIHVPTLVPSTLHRFVGRWIGSITLLVAMLARPAGAATTTTTIAALTSARPASTPTSQRASTISPGSETHHTASIARTYKVGPRESLWSVAEATLGDGSRWHEILDANRNLIPDHDILDEGIELVIPNSDAGTTTATTVDVQRGDNLWAISRAALAAHDDHVTNAEIVPYWKHVINNNEAHLRSGDPDLIYPGENITLPPTPASTPSALPVGNEPTPPAATPTLTLTPTPTPPAVPTTVAVAPTIEPTATAAPTPPTEHNGHTNINLITGLGLTGIAAASILAALAAKRRRITRQHKDGSPASTLTPAARTLISELRGIAKPERITHVDRTLRYLYKQCVDSGHMPAVSIIRAGNNNVELLADDATTRRPDGFALLDDATLVIQPETDDKTIDAAQDNTLPLCPALVTIGSDETGDVLIDLERIGALSIEADAPERAVAALTHIAVEQAGLPWATENTIWTLGLKLPPSTRSDDTPRYRAIENERKFLDYYRPAKDAERSGPIHDARLEGVELLPPTIVLIGPGHDEFASELAGYAIEPGSGLAVVAIALLQRSHWRLVITNNTAELEPLGMNLSPIGLTVATIEPDVAAAIDELISDDAKTDDADDSATAFNDTPPEDVAVEREPVEDVIARIMQPKQVELTILGGAPQLLGVQWNGKNAARADEVVAFLLLHGQACPRELGEALWPGKRNTAQQVIQAVSRTRALLGHEDGQPRLAEGRRNAPYRVDNIGFDWRRFQDLVTESVGRNPEEESTLLGAALALVTATPFSARRERSFEWAADLGYELDVVLAITTAAERAAELALAMDDPDGALAAVDKGRLAVPGHEGLTRLRIEALALTGDSDAVRLEYEAARSRLEDDEGLLADLDPATHALFESVLKRAS